MIFNLIYTYTHGNWIVSPYFQYTGVPKNANIGIAAGSHTDGGAVLLNYAFKHGFGLAVRPEYIKSSSGNLADPNTNLLAIGPGTGAFAFTLTPSYVKDGFFLRGDFSIVHATSTTAAFHVFGPDGTKTDQPRGAIEVGFMF